MKLKKFFKVSFTAALLATAFSSASVLAATSMWKVSKGDDYLYIGGTVHLLPETAFPLPAEFEAAYQATDTLVLEVKMPDMTDSAAQTALLQAMAYNDGRSLAKVLSPEVYQQVSAYFAPYGVQLQQLDGYKPGFVALQMLALEMMKAQMAGEGVDSYFDKKALADGKTMAYLESVESQINLLANMGDGYEDAFMKMNLEQVSDFKGYFSAMVAAWRAGDMNKLNKLAVEPARQLDPVLYQALFVKRNNAWLPQIESMFGNDTKELVLVGAGHLAGDDSVLALLQQAGYQVEQVK
ncbi:conjugative transfer protein GumN [Arsukibacterium ikkense]|uniref:Conjugative transfer protein GumN n=1 Tax=Arsukibacterium ikkense TaxID=336831 RepID=A0A0M2V9T6_9GAMM|nr:TraB/GumN family protein [Arsukibacterium ikkense]KKO45928.1 conjugative transfer protein GumN [Arsukibacterium ikkense]